VGGAVERLPDDLLGGRDGDIGEFAAKVGDGAIAFELDFSAGAFERILAVAVGLFAGFGLDARGDLLSTGNDFLGLALAFLELRGDVRLRLGGLGAREFRGVVERPEQAVEAAAVRADFPAPRVVDPGASSVLVNRPQRVPPLCAAELPSDGGCT